MDAEDTIAAIATPEGQGGIAVIRLSGNRALEIARIILDIQNDQIKPRILYNRKIKDLDDVMSVYMKAPKSYTGEDVIEISSHGGRVIAHEIIKLALNAGARLAEKGEFTKRAFLAGKMDLSQAEAVIEMVEARTLLGAKEAYRQLKGSASKEVNHFRDEVIKILSEIEASIDFPEDVGIKIKEILERAETIREGIGNLLKTVEYGRILRDGLKMVIAGKPNVGKSSLLNAILKADRAIVTDAPGTTRDTIEETLNIGGVPVVAIDTAGVRKPKNKAEEGGIKRAKRAINEADIVLLVYDGSCAKLTAEDKEAAKLAQRKTTILIKNKSDLGDRLKIKGVKVSAKTGEGVPDLEDEIAEKIKSIKGGADSDLALISDRQKQCLIGAAQGLQRAIKSIKIGETIELATIEFRDAIARLGEITGLEVGEQVINNIFESFCVGK